MNKIPYGRQDISEEDIKSVVDVLRSDFLTQGPVIEQFESALSLYCGARHAVVVSNATAALHLACLALDVKPGDLVWTSPNTFVASSNCALYVGANIDFVDIDPQTYNMSVDRLSEKLKEAEKKGRLPKVVIPVHHSGESCDMESIKALSLKYGFKIIEDASHAVGGSYKSKKVGSCEFSDITVFSFHPVKIITTGEGGMVLTNDKNIYEKLFRLRTHGITRDQRLMTKPTEGPWYYQQIDLGFNYRMTDIQAVLGLSQFSRLDSFIEKRHKIAQKYNAELKSLPLTLPIQTNAAYSALHLYVVRLKLNEIKKSQRQVFESLHERGVLVNLHYIPVHLQPYYEKLGFKKGQFPEAEKYYGEAISLPMYSRLTEPDQNRVISELKEILK
ncbi:MAG: UDP-4-amino-4,6-dideoxy-N-acetyl-beta-L-altrosamine transaminase [Oligoflexia bacterium]|nr:UDP-4-amino-4,6-dideoxy-N-acetyl-beta-L-altrosamine transaminase [Oligoflexia bacterium]